jgi:outer membrane protein TolC
MPAPVPPADRLTLSQAVQLGLRINPQIVSARSSIESARQNYNSQKAPINPTVNYAALNNAVAPAQWENGIDLGSNYSAYLTLETNGAISYRTRQAREQYHQAEFDAKTTGLSLSLSIISAYANLQIANRALEVEMKVYGNMLKLSDLTDRRFEAGAGQQADAVRARVAAIQERQTVIIDIANVGSERAVLNAQLGRPQSAPIDAAEPLVFKPEPLPDLAELTRTAEMRRPELLSAIAGLEASRAVPGLQRSQYFPNTVIAKDFGGDGTLFVGLSLPVDLGGIGGSIAKAKADVRTQEAQVEIERQSIDLDVKTSYVGLVSAREQVDNYEGGILSMSQTLVDQVQHGYELGAGTIVDLITAEDAYRSVEMAYNSALGAYEIAVYTLKHSVGELPDAFSGTVLVSTAKSATGDDTSQARNER